jgi:hypothetical protein
MGCPILEVCIGDAAISCLTMAEYICVFACVLEILFLSSVGSPGTQKMEYFDRTTASLVLIVQFRIRIMNKGLIN